MAADSGSITVAGASAKIKVMIWGSNGSSSDNGGEKGTGGEGGVAGFASGTYSYSNIKSLSMNSRYIF